MSWFRDKPITSKVTIAIMLTTSISLLLAGGAFMTGDFLQLHRIPLQEISTLGNIISAEAAALSPGDREGASRILLALQGDQNILAAAVYRRGEDKPVATYYRQGVRPESMPGNGQPGIHQQKDTLLMIRNLELGGGVPGVLLVRRDTRGDAFLLTRDLSLVAVITLNCILIAFLLTSRLRRLISQPIVDLAKTAGRIPPNDGGRLWQSKSSDEVSVLAEAFVLLLSRAEKHEEALRNCRTEIETLTAQAAALEGLNADLEASARQTREISRGRDAFLVHMSHRIRTAMNGVIGMAQLALETDPTPELAEFLTSAQGSAEIAGKVVDEAIDFCRIESGTVTLEREEFDVAETLYELTKFFSPPARKKGLALLLDIQGNIPSTVVGDPARFRQVTASLIDNAIRFTGTGKVNVEVSTVFRSDRVVGLHVKVKDTGRGLTANDFERALEPLARAGEPGVRLTEGSGLGLAMASRLIGMMGGRLWLESEAGSGSTVQFTATFETSGKTTSPALDLNDLRGANVLVAEGNAATRRILQQLLSMWQMRTALAASGPEAIELLRSAGAEGRPFDIALVDRHMLGIDGSQLAMEIRKHPELGSPIITVLSSINTLCITDLTREFSPSGYLVKPVSHSTLLKAVSGAMRDAIDERRALAPLPRQETGQGPHILVVEDNLINQAVALGILLKDGYEVTVVRSGAQAMETLPRKKADLILMDVEMPEMNGLEATRAIRQREGQTGGHVPILALTANALASDRARCLEAGMDDYLAKPLQADLLRKKVRQWLNRAATGPSQIRTGSDFETPGDTPDRQGRLVS